jgi:hypothetical protein
VQARTALEETDVIRNVALLLVRRIEEYDPKLLTGVAVELLEHIVTRA